MKAQRNDTTQTKQTSGPYNLQLKMGAVERAIYLVQAIAEGISDERFLVNWAELWKGKLG